MMKHGVFHELKGVSLPVIAGLFRARLLKVLLEEGVISQQIVDLLLRWNHHSGFNVHARGRIHGANRKAIENVARYMSRAALSVERVRYNRAEDSVTVTKKPFGSSPEECRSSPVGDFLALLASHIPAPTWARLIRPIFEVDPLRCRRCGAEMRLIAFITDFRQTSRVLEHIGEQTIRPPPLTAKTSPPGLFRPEFVDYIPDMNVYGQDPIYPD